MSATGVCVRARVDLCVCEFVCVFVRARVPVHVCACVYLCMHSYVRVLLCLCMSVFCAPSAACERSSQVRVVFEHSACVHSLNLPEQERAIRLAPSPSPVGACDPAAGEPRALAFVHRLMAARRAVWCLR